MKHCNFHLPKQLEVQLNKEIRHKNKASVKVRALNKRMERIKSVHLSKIEISDYKFYRGLRTFHL